jgi:hypothetical protein
MTSKSPILFGNAALCGKANMQKQHGKTHTKNAKSKHQPPAKSDRQCPDNQFSNILEDIHIRER